MRSNSESLATKCFTVTPTSLDCTPRDEPDREPGGEVRVLRVALEVPARERVAMQVDRRREQHVRALGARLLAERRARPARASSGSHVAPSAEPHGTHSAALAGAARAAGAVRAVGHPQPGNVEAGDARRVPQVGPGDERRLLLDGRVAQDRLDAFAHARCC